MRTLNFKILTSIITLSLLVIGIVIYVNAKEQANVAPQEAIYWFSIDSSGDIDDFLYEGPTAPCEGEGELCAVGLLESRNEVDPGDDNTDPTPTITDPNQALHKSMGELP